MDKNIYRITWKKYNDLGVLKHCFFESDLLEECLDTYEETNGFDYKFFINGKQVSESEFERA